MLLDTSICIDFLRHHQNAIAFIHSAVSKQEPLFLSVITETELFAGDDSVDSVRRRALEEFLAHFSILPVDSSIARKAGLFKRQNNASFPDALIAATAIENNLPLVSRDQKAFSKIKELKLVKPY